MSAFFMALAFITLLPVALLVGGFLALVLIGLVMTRTGK